MDEHFWIEYDSTTEEEYNKLLTQDLLNGDDSTIAASYLLRREIDKDILKEITNDHNITKGEQ